ncbi:MAG: hypothetical protein RJB64_1608 [Pseudomonadota bacterium]
MHNAPSVTYPVGRLLLERAVTLALVGLALVAIVTMVTAQPWGWGPALTLCSGLLAWAVQRRSHRLSSGYLSWDGKEWWLSREVANLAGRVRVEWDLQGFLLLRFEPLTESAVLRPLGAGGQWVWLAQQADPATWADLRRAVYCRVS